MQHIGMTFGKTKDSYFTFFSHNRQYEITKFQRPYTWTEYQINGVIADLEYIWKEKQSVSWASILLQKQPENPQEPNVTTYDVGDGQQRIISINLAVLALWHVGHKLLQSSRDQDTQRFLDSIVPSQDIGIGLLAAAKKGNDVYALVEIVPKVKFQAAKVQQTFKSLFSPMNIGLQHMIEEATGKLSTQVNSEDRILRNFSQFYKYFSNKVADLDDLQKMLTNILEKFCLGVGEYEATENMQRAFSNMNSYGVNLTESELVKSELYGAVRKSNAALSDEITDYWTDNLETVFWKSAWNRKSADTMLDYCLRQSYLAHTNFDVVKEGVRLKDLWSELVTENANNLAGLWNSLKSDIELFKIALSDDPLTPGSNDWETNYTYQIIGATGKNTVVLSFLMKMKRILPPKEYALSARLFVKYFLYLVFGTSAADAVFPQLLNRKHSPLLQKTFTYNDLQVYLEQLNARTAQWRDCSVIQSRLESTSFSNHYNALLSELFIYVNNEQKRKTGNIMSLNNSRGYVQDKSREHVLPQNPANIQMTPQEKVNYDFIVGLIGNSIPLGNSTNRKSSNRPVQDKIKEYETYDDNHNAWGFWVRDFLTEFEGTQGVWDEHTIRIRTKRIAPIIAEALAPDNPNMRNLDSLFHTLLNKYPVNSQFYALDSRGKEYEFLLDETGVLIGKTGTLYGKEFSTLKTLSEVLNGGNKIRIGWENFLYVTSGDPASTVATQ